MRLELTCATGGGEGAVEVSCATRAGEGATGVSLCRWSGRRCDQSWIVSLEKEKV
jgi:hypothetical protein